MTQPSDDKAMQGEGNYDAGRRYDKAAREFVQSGQVEAAARAARPISPEEADALLAAERAGQSHAKGDDADIAPPPLPNLPNLPKAPA